MRKLFIIFSLVLAVVACTKKVIIPDDPSDVDDGRTEVRASVDDYGGQPFVWTASTRIGVYDAEGRANQRYTLTSSCIGKSGEVSLYGPTIGRLPVAYLPYSAKGYPCVADHRQPVLPEQTAGISAQDHLRRNAVLIAEADEEGRFRFSYGSGNTGLLHLTLKCPVDGLVAKVVLHCPEAPLAGNVHIDAGEDPLVADGSHYLTLTDVGRPCTATAPLEVWAQVPSGEYRHLTVSVFGGDGAVSAVTGNTLKVSPGGTVNVTAESRPNEAGNEDLTIIDGTYQ